MPARTAIAPVSKRKPPKLRHHKASGQGFTQLDGRFIYFGQFDDPATVEKYHRTIAEWLAAGQQLPVAANDLTVKELVARFWVWAEEYYGRETGANELSKYRRCAKPLIKLYGQSKAVDFGPLALQTVRRHMIDKDWCRHSVNEMTNRVRNIFRWGTSQELLPAEVYHALQSVTGLRRGRSNARESEPVGPVDRAMVEAIRPYLNRQVAALVELQLLTGARGGELLGLRPCDIDKSRSIWTYQPQRHKNALRGKRRTIYFGPKAQDVLRPFLLRPDDACLFSPAEAERQRRAALHAQRITPKGYGNGIGTNRSTCPQKTPGEQYTKHSYRRAIHYACDLAFPPPPELARRRIATGKTRTRWETQAEWNKRLGPAKWAQLKAWIKSHRWKPHQLRHTAATEIRREFGLEAAQIALGHSSALVTEAVYAERDMAKVEQVMLKIG
jgi:integrase